ncbi:MAG: MG2 domain-containing protein, partial [Anaerolineales bacterium]|nr:MG2 domain-containing protein [Anaerolineales bacterium]
MSRNRLISFSILGLFLLVVVATLILTSYYEKLPENIVPQETIILGQNRMVPGSQAALRVVVRDARDSSPLPQADIRVSMKPTGGGISKEVYRGRTDTQGTAEVVFKVPEDVDPNQTLIVETNSNLGSYTVERPVTLERDYRLLLTTDKPIYQPGQVIHLRALVLSTFDLKPAANSSLEIVIADGKGNKVFRKTLTTSEFGVAAADFQLAAEVNTGQYKISATYVGGNSTPAGVTSEKTVNVEHYVLPKFSVKLENDRTYYRPGQHVQGMLQADYFFGKSVAGAEVLIEGYTFDVERVVTVSLKGQTDEKGKYEYLFNLPDYVAGIDLEGGLGRYYIQARVTDLIKHTETSILSIPVASSALIIEAVPEGGLIRTGVENILYVLTSYPDGSPAETNLEIQFVENSQNTQVKTGAYGLAEVRFTPRDPYQTITINAWDASGNMALRQFSFEGDYSEETVLLRPDRPVYRVGETMNLTIFTSAQQGTVYLDIVREGQTVSTRSVQVNAGKAEIAVDLTPDLFGSLELHAYKILSWGGITRDTRLVVVDNAANLNINLTPQCAESSSSNTETACVYRPGDTANVDVQVKDQNGSGIRSALGIAIVDESVFAMAEQDPGFAKLYFLLENELLKPKYELHDLSLLDLILSPQKDQFEGKGELEKAVNEAAKASLAAVSPQTPGFSLQVNSHEEAMQKASEQQRGFYTNLSKVLYWLILLLSVMIISLSGYALWRKERLGRSLALAIGLFIAFFLLLMIIPQGFDWYQISEWLFYEEESVLIVLGLLALIGYFTLVVIAWRQKDRLLGWTLGLSLVFIGIVILLVNISSRGSYYPDGLVVDLMALTLAFLPLGYMLRLADFIFERQILQFFCTIPLILVLLVGFLPIIGMVNSNLLPGITPANLLRGEPALLMERDFAQFEAAQPMAAPMATAMPVAEEVPGNKGTASGAVAQEPPHLRQYFPETMLWLPEVVTDEKGYLKMDVPVADSITTWRMTALASTQDGRLGSTTGAFHVFQDFFIDLDLPQNLTVGDEVSVPIGLFNYLDEPQTVLLELERTGWFDLLEESNNKEITIASNDITVVYFRVRAKDFGLQTVKVTAWGSLISDAIQKQVHVFPDG